jgi:hypothetical protein
MRITEAAHNSRSSEMENQKPAGPKIKRAATEKETSKARKGNQRPQEWTEELSLFSVSRVHHLENALPEARLERPTVATTTYPNLYRS